MKPPFPSVTRHVQTLKRWLDRYKPCGVTVHPVSGTVTAWIPINGKVARDLLKFGYAGQRNVSSSQVNKLKVARANNSWLDHNPLIFACHMDQAGDEILSIHNINGQHTLWMLADTDATHIKIELRISSGDAETAAMYIRIDVGKSRTQRDANRSADIYSRLGFDEDNKNEKSFCDRGTAGAVYLLGGMSQSKGVLMENKENKIQVTLEFADEIRRLWSAVQGILVEARRRPKKDDEPGCRKVEMYNKLYNSLTMAPIYGYLILAFRHRPLDIAEFLDAAIRHYGSGTTDSDVKRSDAREYMTQKAASYMMQVKKELSEIERSNHAATFHQIFMAYLNCEKIDLKEAQSRSNRHAVWEELVGRPFSLDLIGVWEAAEV
jgi:hypothetical protein